MRITLDLPDDLASTLGEGEADLSRFALEALVADAYRNGRLTVEQVRVLLGYGTRIQVDEFLGRHRIFDYTLQDLRQDRETLKRLRPGR